MVDIPGSKKKEWITNVYHFYSGEFEYSSKSVFKPDTYVGKTTDFLFPATQTLPTIGFFSNFQQFTLLLLLIPRTDSFS